MTPLQAIAYRGRTVAAATPERFFLSDDLDRRPRDDPERTFVIFMCGYAGEILRGELPGRYRDDDARRFARSCLIPRELVERAALDVHRAARALRVPATEILAARDDASAEVRPSSC